MWPLDLGLGSQINFYCLPSVWCFVTAAHMDEDEGVGGLWSIPLITFRTVGDPLLSSLIEGESK